MRKLSVKEAYEMAGVYRTDSALEQDIKFEQFFRQYRYRIVSNTNDDIDDKDIDFLITKD